MSLRNLHKHRTEAAFASAERNHCCSRNDRSIQKRINAYHRAVRRSQREVIALELLDLEAEPLEAEEDEDFFWDIDFGPLPSELHDQQLALRNLEAHPWAAYEAVQARLGSY